MESIALAAGGYGFDASFIEILEISGDESTFSVDQNYVHFVIENLSITNDNSHLWRLYESYQKISKSIVC